MIKEGPTVVCVCCGGLWFPGQTKTVTKAFLLSREATEEFIERVFNVETTDQLEEFCDNCSLFVKKKKVPRLCLSNGLKLPEISEEIKRLNRIEERLVAARHVYQSIYTVFGLRGQYKSKGEIVNVPVSVDKTVSCIPRLPEDTNIIQVTLKRRLDQANNYMSGNVNIASVWAAAVVLKDTDAYKKHTVTIRDSLEIFNELSILTSEQNLMDELVEALADIDINDDDAMDEIANPGGAETLYSGIEFPTMPIEIYTEGIQITPAEDSRPMRLLLDKDVEYLAFSTLFGGAIMEPIYEEKPISYASIVKS
ncbi:hypothetical protein A0J61_11151 [Choanephora cucurbitarum]|uniref:DUF6570 domain-containing protein n=1 Tax=Choanephora cucurbitarum TaxID=101091 RepID=A0A1C7MVF8_9FUNG|nr:hypothetical protein A0J61_11151 [Choanephora cucurbitarum]